MNVIRYSLMLFTLTACALAQSTGSRPPGDPTTSGAGQSQRQSNAASATKDNSAISGDQVTKPAGAKAKTVIGCLAGPDSDGHLMLNSMQYRSGVEVLGPTNLSSAAGQKVKLTGEWVANPGASGGDKQQSRRFQATSFDVLADKCPPPVETTPTSKKKQKQQKADAKADQASNPK